MATAPVPDLTFNPQARIQGRYIGREGQPLLIIDDVLKYPQSLVDYATHQSVFRPPSERSSYPGLNGDLPPAYGTELVRALRPLLQQGFGILERETLSYQGFFGLTTARAQDLQPLQLIPHCDSQKPFRLAMVHYFCGAPFRGTAFFRHRSTGFEHVDHRRYDTYRTTVEAELGRAAPPQAYVDQATPYYEQIDQVEAVFNRLAVYRTTSLHSALMDGGALTADPATGRLTANSFVEAIPPTA